MASVTDRIDSVKQPRGGYVKSSEFSTVTFNDGVELNLNENVSASMVGTTVDYLTRYMIADAVDEEPFEDAYAGARALDYYFGHNILNKFYDLERNIKGLDDKSIISATQLSTFISIYRNPMVAIKLAEKYGELAGIQPDKETIENIRTLVKRGVTFLKKYGPVTKYGFNFDPSKPNKKAKEKMCKTGKGSYGGYTPTVDAGDGDFLTTDTLWDFKVSKSKPTSKHTLQLLMYWIMGQHSGQAIFKNITKLGIFNPRLNTVYLLDISSIPVETIRIVEKEIICYQ